MQRYKENLFLPRIMSKIQLAKIYFPDSSPKTAMRRLQRWIARCVILRELLNNTHSHYWTKREVETIAEYLGEP